MELIQSADKLNVGDFIKVSQTNGPKNERLNFSGKIISQQGDRLEIHTVDGIIGIGWTMTGVKLEVYKLDQKPNGWDKHKAGSHKTPAEIVAPIVTTTKQKIFTLVKNNPKKHVDKLMTMAKREIDGDESTLRSFIQLAISKFRSA